MRVEPNGPSSVYWLEWSAEQLGTAAILLMVVGCTGGLDDCREISVPASHYASTQDCEHDMNLVVEGASSRFDHIYGACAHFDEELLQTDVEIVWDVTALNGLEVSLEPVIGDDMVVARHADPSEPLYRN
jgi:hypothetical protein